MAEAQTVVYTWCDGAYEDFVALFALSLLVHNDDVAVEVGVEDDGAFRSRHRRAWEVVEQAFPGRAVVRSVPPTVEGQEVASPTVRFVTEPVTPSRYVYISDVDILTLEGDITRRHVADMERHGGAYSNAVRPQVGRLSGLHFCLRERSYPLPPLDGLPLGSFARDEAVLYEVVRRKGIEIDPDPKRWRPVHGIHMSPNRSALERPGWGIARHREAYRAFRADPRFVELRGRLSERVRLCLAQIELVVEDEPIPATLVARQLATNATAERFGRAWRAEAQDAAQARAFWQSPVVMAEVRRRITGERDVDPVEWFARTRADPPLRRGLSLGCGHGVIETALVAAGACERLVGIDPDPQRVATAQAAVPAALAERLRFEVGPLESGEGGGYDLIVVHGVLGRVEDPESWLRQLARKLATDGLLYVDDYIGAPPGRWSAAQVEAVDRLVDQLPDRLQVVPELDPDDVAPPRSPAPRVLADTFDPVDVRAYGGGLLRPFFDGVAGAFAQDPDLVRLVAEFDFLLTDFDLLPADYLWGVYRKRPSRVTRGRRAASRAVRGSRSRIRRLSVPVPARRPAGGAGA